MDCGIIVPRRKSIAHLHRPWRAISRCTIGCDLASHCNAAHALMSPNSRRGVQTRYMERPRHQAGLDRRPLLAFTYRCCNFASKEASSRASVQLVALEQLQLKAVHLLKGRTLGYHFGMDCRIADELIAMAEHDRNVSDELAASGALYEGYDPRMAAVHEKNALRLRAIMAQIGWPAKRLVGKRAADAAWLIVQHAIAHPEFQRSCLKLLAAAAHEHLVPAWQPAMLEDRIRVFEGRPQLYGTQLEPDAHGNMRPHTIEDPDGVDERRRAVSLEPLAEILARAKPQPLPADHERFEHDYQEWLIAVGWRTRPQSSS